MKTIKNKSIAVVLALSLMLAMFSTGCSKEVEETIPEITTESTTKQTTEDEFIPKEITVDFYQIPEVYYSFLSEEEIDFYNKFVTAWLNYEPSVEFEDINNLPNVWGMVQECFFISYGDLDVTTGYGVEDNHVYLHYLSSSKEEHDEIIRNFEERVQYFFEDIDEREEGIELARHLYINYNRTLDYSYDVVENDNYTFENSSGYAALMRGEGVCMSFAKAYTYLLRQAGIEAFDISNIDHEWAALRIDGKYYFADPTWDYVYDNPEDYNYFCFGLDQRESDGYPAEEMCLCCNGDIKMTDYVDIERENYVAR